ncbi:exosortase F system-associated protein [Pseudotenacibaculum sp. MALMAid0570]|uniref:exosortase F system-associated membrane protein n=1 Tax=Pseudotenacibaculum sp. MALMAid0570 TaxID=3143938 RepID=UPI0032DEAA9D
MNKSLRIILIFILFGLLFLVRAYEMDLFYDPLIEYFQNDYLYKPIPEINSWHLVVDMLFRYTINSLITLGIIYIIFHNKKYVKFSGFLLMFSFMIMIAIFSMLLRTNFEAGYLFPFYIRRFIVHPLFLLILLPAFFYHQRITKK